MELQQLIEPSDFIEGVRSRCAFMKNDITALSKGCQFWKVRSGTDWYLRRFWLDTERMCLRYVPSQKPFWNSCPTHVDLMDITEVRRWKTDFYQQIEKRGNSKKWLDSALSKKMCFTVVFGEREYNLIAQDEDTSSLWLSTLKRLVCIVRSVHHENQYWIWLRLQFRKADEDRTGALTFKQVRDLLERINIKLSRKYAKDLFNAVNVDKKQMNGKQVLDCQEFLQFFRNLTKRSELEEIFETYAVSDSAAMTADELKIFLAQEQFLAVDTCGAPAPKVKIKHKIWQRSRGRRQNRWTWREEWTSKRENRAARNKTREAIVVFNMVPKPNLTNISGYS